jgi:hypothetical protein
MRDAFGVELDGKVEKAMGLRPVADFIKGASNALRGRGGAANYTQAGARAGQMVGRGRQAVGAMRQGAAAGYRTTRTAMPKVPRPSGNQMKVGGAIGGTGLAAGATGYALGGQKKGY